MNGKPTDWQPSNGELVRMTRGHRSADRAASYLIAAIIIVLAIMAFTSSEAEAARRFVQKSSSCPNGQCAIKQQAVVQHVQQVVAQPVVHHAAVVAQPVCAAPVVQQQAYAAPSIHTQNNWYSVGQPLVQHAQLVAAARDAVAEQTFKATVQGSFNATVNGAGQSLYQQQPTPAPVYQQPVTPTPPPPLPPEPQPPAEPDAPPTFSMTLPDHFGSVVEQQCAMCHSNGVTKGGFSLDGADRATREAAASAIAAGRMPKGKTLSDSTKLALVTELLLQP